MVATAVCEIQYRRCEIDSGVRWLDMRRLAILGLSQWHPSPGAYWSEWTHSVRQDRCVHSLLCLGRSLVWWPDACPFDIVQNGPGWRDVAAYPPGRVHRAVPPDQNRQATLRQPMAARNQARRLQRH